MRTLLAVAVGLSLLCLPSGGVQNPQAPAFRTRTVLVPIDVRVLDRNGRPVTGLTQDDFTILEDGVSQKLTLFERQALTPMAVDRAVPLVLHPATGAAIGSQTRRVFLIMFGTPRLLWLASEPFGTAEAVTRFIRERLLPQDYVAVAAWNRATGFTTDHEQAAQLVERLRAYEDALARSRNRAATIRELNRARRGSLTAETQAKLDEVFQPGSSHARTISHLPTLEVRNLIQQIEDHTVTLQHGSADRSAAAQDRADRAARMTAAAVTGEILDIAGGIEYLRYVQGEKHLVYISPNGLWLPAVDDDKSLARIANDARVVIDVIQTGGLPTYDEFGRLAPGRVNLDVRMASGHVAQLTGGHASFYDAAERALARIDVTTRSGYLLAYYPSNPTLDGRLRKLTVRVSRPRGATVLSRRSYLAQPEGAPYDYRQFVIQDRIVTAAQFDGAIEDIKVVLGATTRHGAVSLDVRIDPTHVAFERTSDDRRTASLDIAFFCSDARERLVGELWQKLDLNLKAETYRGALRDGLRHAATVPVNGTPRSVRVVVYDYASDRTGAAVVPLGRSD